MKRIYQVLILIALVLIIYFFQDWLRTFVITSLGGFTKKETVTLTNTKYIKGKWEIDSIAVFNKYVETKVIILNPKPKIVYETKYDTIRDTIYSKKLKQFEVKFTDTLIDGKMTIKNYFNGDLHSANFKYKSLATKIFKRVDTIEKTIKTIESLHKERAKIGFGIGYDWSKKNIQFLGSYTFKNDWQIIYEYEPIFTKQTINGIHNTSNNSIKIIKNF